MCAEIPNAPIIGFPRGAAGMLGNYARTTGVNLLGLDYALPLSFVKEALPSGYPVQGNLDPLRLAAGGAQMERRAEAIIEAFADRPHVFNLGHGILPETPIEHVTEVDRDREGKRLMWIEWVKAFHVISVIAWIAGMMYLPRLFVYHAAAREEFGAVGNVQDYGTAPLSRHHHAGNDPYLAVRPHHGIGAGTYRLAPGLAVGEGGIRAGAQRTSRSLRAAGAQFRRPTKTSVRKAFGGSSTSCRLSLSSSSSSW